MCQRNYMETLLTDVCEIYKTNSTTRTNQLTFGGVPSPDPFQIRSYFTDISDCTLSNYWCVQLAPLCVSAANFEVLPWRRLLYFSITRNFVTPSARCCLCTRVLKVLVSRWIITSWRVQEFFKEHPAPAAARTVQQSLENVCLNAEQLKRDGDLIHQFLASYQ